jgi:hypothetical protein
MRALSALLVTTHPFARVPATCPIASPGLVLISWEMAAQLTFYELAQAIGDCPLAGVAAVQVDQRGPWAAVAHAVHQFAERGPGRRR